MAHAVLHIAIGFGLGSAWALPRMIRALPATKRAAPVFARTVALCAALGILAWIPQLLRKFGMPEWTCSGWWMNVFILHPFVSRHVNGGMLIGYGILITSVLTQYSLLLLAIRNRRRVKMPEDQV